MGAEYLPIRLIRSVYMQEYTTYMQLCTTSQFCILSLALIHFSFTPFNPLSLHISSLAICPIPQAMPPVLSLLLCYFISYTPCHRLQPPLAKGQSTDWLPPRPAIQVIHQTSQCTPCTGEFKHILGTYVFKLNHTCTHHIHMHMRTHTHTHTRSHMNLQSH